MKQLPKAEIKDKENSAPFNRIELQ